MIGINRSKRRLEQFTGMNRALSAVIEKHGASCQLLTGTANFAGAHL